MTTATRSQPVEVDVDDDDVVHLVCCSDDIALCGADVEEGDWTILDDDIDCPLCAHISEQGLPCPVPGC